MSIIVNDLIDEYILNLYNDKNDFLKHLREIAERDNIPIVTRDTEQLMSVLLTMHKPKRMLEIGTAIGYSAISFASTVKDLEIISIELSDKMFEIASNNIKNAGLDSRIKVLKGDAKDILLDLDGSFDMIFIDAAKGHYQLFFERCMDKLSENGVIISDNVLYKGMTASNEFLIKRKRTIVKRMREFMKYISNHPLFDSAILPVGDGIAISVRKAGE